MNEYRLIEYGIFRTSDEASIPPDPENRDYRAYLEWVDEGGMPDPLPVFVEPEPDPEEEAKRAEFAAVRDKVAEALSLTPAEAVSLFGSNGDSIPETTA